jgi:hypothetical protein
VSPPPGEPLIEDRLAAAFAYVDASFDRLLDDLAAYCRYPSWGGHDAGMEACAAWLRSKLESLGFEVELVPR